MFVSPICHQPRPRSRHEQLDREQHTFLPGLPSIAPTAFSTTPLTLSITVGVLLFLVAGAFFFSTRPAVIALARGLEVFAFAFGTVDFLEVDLGLGAESSMAKSTRGVLFFRSPGRLPSRTSFDFAIADGWEGRMKKMRGLGYKSVECLVKDGYCWGLTEEFKVGLRGLFTFGITELGRKRSLN